VNKKQDRQDCLSHGQLFLLPWSTIV